MIGIQPGSIRSALHVIFQIALTALIYITGPSYPDNIILLVIYILLFALAIWAMYIMKFRFNISPEPFSGVNLVSEGPYRFIRHPMYTALLGVTVCLVAEEYSVIRLAYWLLLGVNMYFKLSYEEKLLAAKFPGYKEYMKRSKRLIPFVF